MNHSAASHQSPELLRLFETYTGGPQGIGANLAALTGAATAGDPHTMHIALEAAVREHLQELGEMRPRVD